LNDSKTSEFVEVGTINDFPKGNGKRVMVDGHAVAIFERSGSYYAVEDSCSHQHAQLAHSAIEKDGYDLSITCPRHGARFDLKTGRTLSLPAYRGIRKWNLKIENGKVLVDRKPMVDAAQEILRLEVESR